MLSTLTCVGDDLQAGAASKRASARHHACIRHTRCSVCAEAGGRICKLAARLLGYAPFHPLHPCSRNSLPRCIGCSRNAGSEREGEGRTGDAKRCQGQGEGWRARGQATRSEVSARRGGSREQHRAGSIALTNTHHLRPSPRAPARAAHAPAQGTCWRRQTAGLRPGLHAQHRWIEGWVWWRQRAGHRVERRWARPACEWPRIGRLVGLVTADLPAPPT